MMSLPSRKIGSFGRTPLSKGYQSPFFRRFSTQKPSKAVKPRRKRVRLTASYFAYPLGILAGAIFLYDTLIVRRREYTISGEDFNAKLAAKAEVGNSGQITESVRNKYREKVKKIRSSLKQSTELSTEETASLDMIFDMINFECLPSSTDAEVVNQIYSIPQELYFELNMGVVSKEDWKLFKVDKDTLFQTFYKHPTLKMSQYGFSEDNTNLSFKRSNDKLLWNHYESK
mmetsp:Transcript_4230/g.4737  ORF Transcript_4230/g.4737 Transcript_4230/m.4737 type:complete len:229 (+) Transcript_4230:36-722(+)